MIMDVVLFRFLASSIVRRSSVTKLIWSFSVWSIGCLSILKAEPVENDHRSPTAYSFQVTARLDPQGHFEVVSWRITKLADQRLSQFERRGDGVSRPARVPQTKGNVKDLIPFSRTYPIDLFLERPGREQH
jgi:hypothetical protein